MNRQDVIDHLQIIRTWNECGKSFAFDETDLKEKTKTVEWIDDALELLQEHDSEDATLVEMMLPNDGSMFLNTEYITGYGYSKEQDKTVVSVLSEGAPVFFPGDQTAKIRNAFNHISKNRR